MKKVLYVVVFIVIAGFLGVSHGEASGPKIPAFELRSLEGNTYSDQDLIGRPTLLMFWTSWCHVCQGEIPKVHTLQEKMKGKGLQILAIGFADPEANIRDYVASHPGTLIFPSCMILAIMWLHSSGSAAHPHFFFGTNTGKS